MVSHISFGRGPFILLVLLCLAAVSCSTSEPPPKPRDILLITIDTARADRFSHLDGQGPGTPHIDALAAEGAAFAAAISPVPLTLPAHASLFTGRQPPGHTVRDNGAYRLPEAETTLAELLANAGYATGAFIGAQVLDAKYGLAQGFATYDDEIPVPVDSPFLYYAERTGGEVAAAALRWIEAQDDRPVFAWVHLFDPHTPYRPPEPERSRHESAYDGEIAYADRVVGQLITRLEEVRGVERTLVVVTSDHGEALGEHGEATHGVLVHDATLRVPLVIRAPGLQVGEPIAEPVSLIDVLPTVLGLLGLPVPDGVHGRDLGPALRGESVSWTPAAGYAESLYAQRHHGAAPLVALREQRWKLVRGVADELYDLHADAGELRDVAPVERARTDHLAADLDALLAAMEPGETELVTLDEESRRALQSLGYSWGGSSGNGAPRDPREALVSMRLMADADRAFLAGDVDRAVAGYRQVLDSEPHSVDARVRLAELLLAAARGAEAVGLLAEAVVAAPHEPVLHHKLGYTLEKLGRCEEGLAAYDAGLSRHPAARELRDGRWRCLNQLQRLDEMLGEAERAIALDPTDGMARFARAVACCSQPLSAYRAALERELADLPGNPILEAALAAVPVAGADQ